MINKILSSAFNGLREWLKKNQTDASDQDVAPVYAPGTSISYSPVLIDEFKHDHAGMLDLFGEIQRTATARDHTTLARLLNSFNISLRNHVLKEKVRLYVYLNAVYKINEENTALLNSFSREMHVIGRAATDFLFKYANLPVWKEENWKAFESELGAIGEILVKRIQTEEAMLYPLYLPIDSEQAEQVKMAA